MSTDRPDLFDLGARPPDGVLRYADHDDGVVDLYLPTVEASLATPGDAHTPLVVLIHGGFWRAVYDRTHLRPLAAALAERGLSVALPEFRRLGRGGEWPVIGQDVQAALSAIEARVPRSGPDQPDRAQPGRAQPSASRPGARRSGSGRPLVVAGHSAGGHLALWAGLRAGPTRVGHIVALAPVSDVYAAAAQHLGNGATAALLGGSPEEVPNRYADANPLRHLPSPVPVTIIQGDRDDDVPVELNRSVAGRYPSIEYCELPGVDHMGLVDPREPACTGHVIPALASTGATAPDQR